MKRTIPIIAVVIVTTAVMVVWLARPSLIEPDSDMPVSAAEPVFAPVIPQQRELAPDESFSVSNDLEVLPVVSHTQSGVEVDTDAAILSATERAIAAFNAPSPSQLEDAGYMEIFVRDRSSYAGYDIDTLVALSEAGDKRALLHASLRPSSPLALSQRKQYAIEAAKQGYTSALVGLGAQLLMPTKEAAEKLEPDPVLGFALMVAAYEAGDAALRAGDSWAYVKSHLSEKQQEKANVLAHQMIERIGARL